MDNTERTPNIMKSKTAILVALIAMLAIALTGCGSQAGAGTADQPSAQPTTTTSAKGDTTGQTNTGDSTVTAVPEENPKTTPVPPGGAPGGQGGQAPVTSHGGPVRDYVSLIDNLRAAGATVDPVSEISQPFFSVKGYIIKVNGEDVQVFEYESAPAAEADAAKVSTDGSSVGTSMVNWMAPPHFYKKERVIALYVGDNSALTQLLESVLGPQVAGR
jgi:hypothetical protein